MFVLAFLGMLAGVVQFMYMIMWDEYESVTGKNPLTWLWPTALVVAGLRARQNSNRQVARLNEMGATKEQWNKLTEKSKSILNNLESLPASNRPVTSNEMFLLLSALETKMSGEINMSRHFDYHWEPCGNDACAQIIELSGNIKGIKKDLKDQAHALEMSKHTHELESAKDIMARIDDEREAIKSTTKELTV